MFHDKSLFLSSTYCVEDYQCKLYEIIQITDGHLPVFLCVVVGTGP